MNRAVDQKSPVLKKTPSGITLPASESKTHGVRIRYEPETYKNVVGYWTEVDDWVEWSYKIPKGGKYALEIHCGCGSGNGGSSVKVEVEAIDGEGKKSEGTFDWRVRETGHFQNIVIERLGTLELPEGTGTLRVKPQKKAAAAVVDIREIHWIPLDP